MEVLCVDYITTKEAAKNLAIADRMVVYYSSDVRIKEAKKIRNTWRVPAYAEKTSDGRYRSSKVKDGENK